MTAGKIYQVIWTPKAEKMLKKMDKLAAARIRNKVEDYLSINPYAGKRMKENLKGLWSFHFGDYRVLYDILESEVVIEVYEAGDRRDIYN